LVDEPEPVFEPEPLAPLPGIPPVEEEPFTPPLPVPVPDACPFIPGVFIPEPVLVDPAPPIEPDALPVVLLPLPVPVEPGAPAPPPLAPPPPPAPAARLVPQESAATIAAHDKIMIVFIESKPRTSACLSYRAPG
jgi:hypothetical protein